MDIKMTQALPNVHYVGDVKDANDHDKDWIVVTNRPTEPATQKE